MKEHYGPFIVGSSIGATRAYQRCHFCKSSMRELSKRWSPDGQRDLQRAHCGLICYRRYQLLYASDNITRLIYALSALRDRMTSTTDADELRVLHNRALLIQEGIAIQSSKRIKRPTKRKS